MFACGVWAFKPQFAVLSLFLLYLAGEFRSLGWAVLPLVVYYGLGALTLGFDWPLDWISVVSAFAHDDFIANQHRMISNFGFAKAVGVVIPSFERALVYTASVINLALFLHAGWFAYQIRQVNDVRTRQTLLTLLIAYIGPLALLLSPHTLFYDLGIAVVAAAVCLRPPRRSLLFGVWGVNCPSLVRSGPPSI